MVSEGLFFLDSIILVACDYERRNKSQVIRAIKLAVWAYGF